MAPAGTAIDLVLRNPGPARTVLLLATCRGIVFDQQLIGLEKKGEKSCPVVFWKNIKVASKDGEEEKTKIVLRYYNVFNISQCEGIPEKIIPQLKSHPYIKPCDEVVKKMPLRPEITHKPDGCYYVPEKDVVNLPSIEHFHDAESYYQTLYHELVHSTGHPNRMNRKGFMDIGRKNTKYYAFEELVAEIGSAFLNSVSGIPEKCLENSAAYIASWLEVLRNDRRFIVQASAQAQKAVDFILGIHLAETEELQEAKNMNEEILANA